MTGAVTLSCLGKTLAPHLTQALGVQVSKPQPSSPRVGAQEKEQTQRPPTVVGAEEEEEKQRPSTADSELKLQEEEKVETQDSGVQCDEDMLAQDAAQPMPASMSLRSGRSGAVQLDVVAKTKSSGAEGSCSTTRTAQRAQQVHDGFARDLGDSSSRPMAAAKGELLFPRAPTAAFLPESPASQVISAQY